MKPTKHQVGQAGEHFVAAEIHRRGASAVTFSGNMPDIDVLASSVDRSRTVAIQVKTKTAGTWHTSFHRGHRRRKVEDETDFWVFVDVGKNPDLPPEFFVVPAWWMENSIYARHKAYLKRHGGQRPRNPDSAHHGIPKSVVKEWRNRWDLLGIFDSN